ncbi:MAG TPA: two-component regulator propeller domain-containing protein [Methylomirabilota bacterium]|nr:two-component regulator propeller domain-containing protein [Methylomirabilota bacterium]
MTEPWRLTLAHLAADGRWTITTNAPINYGDAYAEPLTNYLLAAPGPWPGGPPPAMSEADLLLGPAMTPSLSNAPSLPAHPPYRIDHWKAGHGLPSNRVRSLQQTRDGYLWIGTLHGLARFDGVRFTVFTERNTPALAATSDDIRCLAEDGEGCLWLGTANGLVRYRRGQFEAFTHEPQVSRQRITSLAATARHGLLVGTDSGILAQFRDGSFHTRHALPVAAGPVYHIGEDLSGLIWVVFRFATARLDLRTGDCEIVHRGPGWSSFFNRTYCDRQGRVWLGADGLVCWQNGQLLPSLVEPTSDPAVPKSDAAVWDIAEDGQGHLWVAMGYGADNLHRVISDGVVEFRSGTGPIQDARCLQFDREDNLWVGTYESGLVRVQALPVATFHFGSRSPFAKVRSVVEAQDGSLWFATEGGPVHWAGRTITAFGLTNAGGERPILPILALRSGGAIMAHPTAGVIALPRDGEDPLWHQRVQPMLTRAGCVQTMFQARDGSLWLGTGQGLHRWNGRWERCSYAEEPAHDDVRALTEDALGRVWVGTRGGVARCADSTWRVFTERDGLSSGEVLSLYVDRTGGIWAGTTRGLNRFADGRWRAFTNGPLALPAHQVLEDNAGGLWCSGERGLVRAQRDDLEAVAAGRLAEAPLRSLGEADGMGSVLTSNGPHPAGVRGRDGRLYFPTTKGLAVVDVTRWPVTREQPTILLEYVRADGEMIPAHALSSSVSVGAAEGNAPALRLPPGRGGVVEIGFTATSLSAPEKLRLRHRLEGHQERWHEVGLERRAVYTHLRPGRYAFTVSVAAAAGQWSRPVTLLAVDRQPFLRETPGFWVAAGLALTLAFGGVVWWRFRLQRKTLLLERDLGLARERARIARDLHDEMGTDLAHLEVRARSLDGPGGALAVVSRLAQDLNRKLRELVWNIDPDHDTLADLADHLRHHADAFLACTDIRLRLEFDENFSAWPVRTEARRHLPAVLKEALTNVARHSGASEVRVSFRHRDDAVALAVEDNGRGFDPAAARSGNGLNNLEDRAGQLGGRLTISSASGRGTTIRVRVPVARLIGTASTASARPVTS